MLQDRSLWHATASGAKSSMTYPLQEDPSRRPNDSSPPDFPPQPYYPLQDFPPAQDFPPPGIPPQSGYAPPGYPPQPGYPPPGFYPQYGYPPLYYVPQPGYPPVPYPYYFAPPDENGGQALAGFILGLIGMIGFLSPIFGLPISVSGTHTFDHRTEVHPASRYGDCGYRVVEYRVGADPGLHRCGRGICAHYTEHYSVAIEITGEKWCNRQGSSAMTPWRSAKRTRSATLCRSSFCKMLSR